MNFKNAVSRSIVIIVILMFSIVIGYTYHVLGNLHDIKNHPREYSEYVSRYCAEYGVPEYLVYALILTESGFQSNAVSEDGEIGLMQISPAVFRSLLSITKETLETGILYDPETNIKYGTYRLSHLYTEHSRWKTVLAIYYAGDAAVSIWQENPEYVDENGNLTVIPDRDTAKMVETVLEEAELYQKLYY